MEDTRQSRFDEIAAELGCSFDGPIQVGGNYRPAVRDGAVVYVSGQVPRVGGTVAVTGRAGEGVSVEEARRAARICAMRTLAILRSELGSLDAVRQVLKVGVYTACAAGFTQHSEVADAASDVLVRVLGPQGTHARTSVGVYQLPKGATVEVDLVAATL